MPIIESAYDTTVGRAMNIKASIQAAEDIQVSSQLLTENYESTMHAVGNTTMVRGGLVQHGTFEQEQVRPFTLVFVTLDPAGLARNTGNKLVVGDVRPFSSISRTDNRPRVVNLMEFTTLRALMAAQICWSNGDYQTIAGLSPVLAKVYCRWISETLTRFYRLDVMTAIKVRAIAAYFFQCQFTEQTELNEMQKRAMIATALRASGGDKTLEDMLFDLDVIDGIEGFILALKKSIPEAVQLDQLDTGVLLERAMGTWFGFNGKHLAAAALEHPPTFASLLYVSFGQNGYRKAALATIAEQFRGPKGGSEYVRNFAMLLGLE